MFSAFKIALPSHNRTFHINIARVVPLDSVEPVTLM